MKFLSFYFIGFSLLANQARGQEQVDTTGRNLQGYLSEISIVGQNSKRDIQHLPEIVGTSIYAGKKGSLVILDNVQGNIVTNNMRQVLAKIPGVHIWESDASNIQIGVSTRGLSPNRSWEFNVRQNGYDISADPYGYPEAYYNPQLQAVQRIQVVRGAGSLQYGPQFGGMLNYVLRDGSNIHKPLQVETQQTAGSKGLFNTFNSVGGQSGKINYFAFFDHRQGEGWRENSKYKTNTGFATFNYQVTKRLKIGGEFMVYHMLSQQAGGLTDSMFALDAQKSYRSRNWFSTPWMTSGLNADYKINDYSRLQVKLSGMTGDRNSVGYLGKINQEDAVDTNNQFRNREVARDAYRNYSAEVKYLLDHQLFNIHNSFSAGVRAFKSSTSRLQKGKGTRGTGYDLSLVEKEFPTALEFETGSAAVFAENMFRVTDNFRLIPGIRYEGISTTVNGRLSYAPNGSENLIKNETRTRNIFLAGLGSTYHIGSTEIYANYTRNYRPMLFTDLSASPTTDLIDPNLKDANGYNIDLGYRGSRGDYLFFDLSGYYLKYNNRIGTLAQLNPDLTSTNFRTNVGNSTSKGIEMLIEINPVKAWNPTGRFGDLSLFTSYAFIDAVYDQFKLASYDPNTKSIVESDLKGKKVENAPEHILRSGISYNYKGFSLTYQFSHVGQSFSNATNTVSPSADGTSGLIPSYNVSDLTASFQVNKYIQCKAGVNNLMDARYFTRRTGGYPGPGILPADGRTFFLSIGARI